MEAIAALLLLSLFLFGALFNSLFYPPSKLLPWFRSALFSAVSPPPDPPSPASDTTRTNKPKEDLDLKTLFATFDSDGDGFISKGELAESLRRLGLAASAPEVRAMMEKADSSGDGLIDFAEFSELCSSWAAGSGVEAAEGEEELREAFAVFDGDGDGLITVEELSLVLRSLGLKQVEGAEACRDMIRKVDMDGDGVVNFEEFKRMMALKEGNLF